MLACEVKRFRMGYMLLVLRVNEGVGQVTVITIQKSVNKGNVGGARRSPEAYRAQPASPISTNWMVRPKSVVAWSAERPCWRLIVLCFSRPRTIGAPPGPRTAVFYRPGSRWFCFRGFPTSSSDDNFEDFDIEKTFSFGC